MSRSADAAFRLIGIAKKILNKALLTKARVEAKRRGVSLEQAVSDMGVIPPDQFERILRTRRRHGRNCAECGRPTFLLPGHTEENTPCEFCGGPLLGQGDAGSRTLRADGVRDTRRTRERKRPKPASPPPPPVAEPAQPSAAERQLRPEYFETGPRAAFSEADLYGAPESPSQSLGRGDESGLVFSDEAAGAYVPSAAIPDETYDPAAPDPDPYGAPEGPPPETPGASPYAAFGDADDDAPTPPRRRPGDPRYGQ